MSVIQLNENNLEAFKKGIKGKTAVLKFWAPWCGPCVRYADTFKEVAKKMDGNAVFAEINIDEDENGVITNLFNIRSIPSTVIVDENMKELNRVTGAVNAEELGKIVLAEKE
jgi:thiol-disulfide isomerase/thioredoxin